MGDTMRDMTQKEFDKACERHGFQRSPIGFFGYYNIGNGIAVSVFNADNPDSRRSKLAYLLKCKKEKCDG
jgi:hypothetical protein